MFVNGCLLLTMIIVIQNKHNDILLLLHTYIIIYYDYSSSNPSSSVLFVTLYALLYVHVRVFGQLMFGILPVLRSLPCSLDAVKVPVESFKVDHEHCLCLQPLHAGRYGHGRQRIPKQSLGQQRAGHIAEGKQQNRSAVFQIQKH